MIWTTRLAAHVTPQVKWVIRGTAQGSAEKFHVARQEVGGMEAGLTADLNARRAAVSAGKVAEREEETAVRRRRRRRVAVVAAGDMVKSENYLIGNFEKCGRRLGCLYIPRCERRNNVGLFSALVGHSSVALIKFFVTSNHFIFYFSVYYLRQVLREVQNNKRKNKNFLLITKSTTFYMFI